MADQLWISHQTGIRRKGTSFKELQAIFTEQIKVELISEPLLSFNFGESCITVKEVMDAKGYDNVGVIDNENNIIGYINKEDLLLGKTIKKPRPFEPELLITDSTPISNLPLILAPNGFVFVARNDKIAGIVTKADLNKPVFRIYLFAIISLFEMHINYWINSYYPENNWCIKLTEKRVNEAKRINSLRKGENLDISLFDCIQLCDKRDILKSTEEFIFQFSFTKIDFIVFLKRVEKIRNELAHSQTSILSNLKWDTFTDTISRIEKFLLHSDQILEKNIKQKLVNNNLL
jgi:predicted transcriptional regulator